MIYFAFVHSQILYGIKYKGSKLWNYLPDDIKVTKSLHHHHIHILLIK